MPQTKIVCTMGPACCGEDTLREMFQAGMNVARLNFSHGTHAEHAETIRRVRAAAKEIDRPVAILQDLSGPKIRVGEIPGGQLMLTRAETVVLSTRPDAAATGAIPLGVPEVLEVTEPGSVVLLDDGAIELVVEDRTPTDLRLRVLVGGLLKTHKGLNLPGASIPVESVTPKDLNDLQFGIDHGVDWIAQSFVRSPQDVHRLRRAIEERGGTTPILAKVEKREAVAHLPEIIAAADGAMVARGDLGVELPLEEVPLVQKKLIACCNAVGKPVITATQMLESMIQNPRPTRAEVNDICNAVLDGTDAVMLSAETASGQYPVESILVMSRIAERTEASLHHREIYQARSLETGEGIPDAISEATNDIVDRLNPAAVICATSTGATARLVSRFRPRCPIIAATTHPDTRFRLAVSWGIHAVLVPRSDTLDGTLENAVSGAVKTGLVKTGDLVVLTGGSLVEAAGSTNLVRVQII